MTNDSMTVSIFFIQKIFKKLGIAFFCCLFLIGCGKKTGPEVRVGAMKGPTAIGLLHLMEEAEENRTENAYAFTMATGADELTPLIAKGELDIALVPANVAAILYQKTDGGICVIDINTLGVLYMVSGDEGVEDVADLRGKTVYLTGKGTTPDYVLQYLLSENGIGMDEVTLEYRSEATEVAVLLAENQEAVGLLPQPFAALACVKNDKLALRFSMTEEWDKVQGGEGSRLVTGVTVVRTAFLSEHPEAVTAFLKEHAESAAYAVDNQADTARLCVEAGIIANEQAALQAIPLCGITCMTGEEMKRALSGYLAVLYDKNPESVGGSLPEDDFYYGEKE